MESNADSAPEDAQRMSSRERARVIVGGVVLPIGVVLLTWLTASSWSDLPAEMPTHWSGNEADSFGATQGYINTQTIAGTVAAVISAAIGIGNMRSGLWTGLGRGLTAVGVGVTAAIAFGLLIQLQRARGLSTEGVAELGAAAGLLGVVGGFIVSVAVAFWILPKGQNG